MWTIDFTSVQISSSHQTLYRVLCLSQSPNGRAYFPTSLSYLFAGQYGTETSLNQFIHKNNKSLKIV